MKAKSTTLITGASSGIGLYLAHEFSEHGHPLVLVAPDLAELQRIGRDLENAYGVAVHAIASDLEQETAAQEVFDEADARGLIVENLVNNAGHGFRGRFHESPLENVLSMVRLNVEAVLRLTHLFLPRMVGRGSGGLFVTASVAGFEAGPRMAVYHATKAFVLSWAEALSIELEETGISVTALCPGPTDTDFFPKADALDTTAFQKAPLMSPQDVAKAGYQGFVDGDLIVIPGLGNKALVQARRLLSENAQAVLNAKLYENVAPQDRKRERGDIENSQTT